jgi:ArsR family metal-binding transcriptional regulator
MAVKISAEEFVRPPNPNARHLRCFAHLDGDIEAILPHLNTVLKGFRYAADPPTLTLKHEAKLITLTSREIAINMVADQEEAAALLAWLVEAINATWENRANIKPTTEAPPQPRIIDILRGLPGTNCRECGEPTCMVFAVKVSEGVKDLAGCPRRAVTSRGIS